MHAITSGFYWFLAKLLVPWQFALLAFSARSSSQGHDGFVPVRELHVRDRPDVLTHLLALSGPDRYLRFGYAAQDEPLTIWNAKSMFDATRVLGSAIRRVHERDAEALRAGGVDFNVSMIFGGQIAGEGMRLFQVYSPGNFIEATDETPYFQIGESKYGKPVLDRVITPNTPLDEAAKCALVSMDSTLKSNLSVGLPLDMVVYEADRLASDRVICIDENNPYFKMLRESWGNKLRHMFDSIEDPMWHGGATEVPLMVHTQRSQPLKKITTPQEKLI